jgi:hypothetical protein
VTIDEAIARVEAILERAKTRPSGQARIHKYGEEAKAIALVLRYARMQLEEP